MAFQADQIQKQLGRELKRLRGSRKLAEVANDVGMDRRTLARKENAEVRITNRDVLRLCAYYEVDGPETARLSEMAQASQTAKWWKEFEDYLDPNYYRQISLENDAARIMALRPSVVHGLLQTESYMRAIFDSSGSPLDPVRKKAHIRVRLGRQRRLVEPDRPLILDVVMEDGALDKDFGRPQALLEQLYHLRKMAELPNITIRTIASTAPVVFEQLELFEFGGYGGAAMTLVESACGVLLVENQLQVESIRAFFEHNSAYARTPEQTAELITNKITELELAA
jgi:transcriptional regulator with XRE-family HTH domain